MTIIQARSDFLIVHRTINLNTINQRNDAGDVKLPFGGNDNDRGLKISVVLQNTGSDRTVWYVEVE